MKIAHAFGVVLAAALLPSVAAAQSTDPNSTTTTTTTTTNTNANNGTTNANTNGTTSTSAGAGVSAGASVGGVGVNGSAGVNGTANALPPQPPPPPVPVTTESQTTTTPPVVVVQPSATTPSPTYAAETEEEYDSWNAPVFTTGAVLFGGSYAAAAIVSGESDHAGANRLWVPVAGPWLALNDWGNCPIDQPRCDTNTTDKVLLIADGVVQAAGILTMVDGLLMPSSHKVIRRTADTKVHVAPTGNGMMVFGHF